MEEEKKQTNETGIQDKPEGQTEARPDEGTPVKKKINQMTLNELEAKLKKLAETQGGPRSKYAKHIIARKNSLKS